MDTRAVIGLPTRFFQRGGSGVTRAEMTRAELVQIIANGENSGVEFAPDSLDHTAFAKELVAFANFGGGLVLLGVEDDGRISGVTRQDVEQWVMNACRDKVRPEVIPWFEVVRDVDGGKSVAVVRVDRSFHVHHVWHDQHRTYYIRVGTQSREASPEELARLFQQRGAIRSEIQPLSGSSMRDLDLRRLKEYFEVIRQQECPALDDVAGWDPLLVNTELLAEGDGPAPATAAGLLLFGKNPNRLLPQAGIDAAAYPGIEKDYAAEERLSMRGAMVRLGVENQPVENGLWESARSFLQRHLSKESLDEQDRRVRRWDIPSEVLREAVVNALVHRDYLLSSTAIELSVYQDRVEIVSPGRLANGITPERMKAGCRAARNQLIKDTMRDYGYMEHMGMGIPRKIVRGMKEHNGTEPVLRAEEEQFTLILLRSRR